MVDRIDRDDRSDVRGRSTRGLAALLVVGLAAGACTRDRVIASALPNEEPTRRAAESFVHCVEAGTSGCVAAGDNHGGWDALHLLLWLASGSPVGILEALPRQLGEHTNALVVQENFVREVERYATVMRGAECDSVSSQPAAQLIERAASSARKRLERLGMWRGELAEVVEGLRIEAHEELDGGALIRFDCMRDPYRVYLATHDHGGRIVVVGMTTTLAPEFGGDVPSRRDVDVRLTSRPLGLGAAQVPIIEGAVDPWLPFPLEEL
ncbi:MAG: hypothetical protein U0168_17895 [Nannocystaceae bacterium]|jgi:hypothetical protein